MKDNPNPSSAINAVIGKEYSFRGQPLKFSMACFFALEKAGIPLTEIESKPIETSSGIFYPYFAERTFGIKAKQNQKHKAIFIV